MTDETREPLTLDALERHLGGVNDDGELTVSDLGLSLHSYLASKDLGARDVPFSALIAAAMRRADTGNAALLRIAFPHIWRDLQARYNAPGGVLSDEQVRSS